MSREVPPPSGESPRPRIDGLFSELSKGSNIHGLVHSVLLADTARMYAYHRGDLRVPLVDDWMKDTYELRPGLLGAASSVITPEDFSFVDGFSYVSRQLYPSVVDASKRMTGELPEFPEGFVEDLMNAPEEERARFADLVAATPQLRVRVSGEVTLALERDPSGVSWLEQQVRGEFQNAGMALVGADRAVIGAGKLFDLLTASNT